MRRREEGIPVLEQKFLKNLQITYDATKSNKIYSLCTNQEELENTSVTDFQELFAVESNNF